ncbi:DUF4190 domain-containing protein [Planococcus sp. MERTA32b]|nr:DUF4190 domain-containing protein [Planococcus sp. MER TA 32b]
MVGRTHQNRSRITNSNAIIALTLGILSIFIPFAGLILGSIGIVVYRKAKNEMLLTGEGGDGIAVSGLICSIVGVLIQLLTIAGYLLYTVII